MDGQPKGRLTKLSGDRRVFVGKWDDVPDTICLGFYDGKGHVKKLSLSKEAAKALIRSLSAVIYEAPDQDDQFVLPEDATTWRVLHTYAENDDG